MAGSSILHYFKKGADVEINSSDQGFYGSWYAGTVIQPPENESSPALVEYRTLKADKRGKRPLREYLSLSELRPSQPRENRREFKYSDGVDAYYNDGWWEGIIVEASQEKDEYKVFFRWTREERHHKAAQLRLHREWVRGEWVPPFHASSSPDFEPYNNKAPSSAEEEVESNEEVTEHTFSSGDLVEACSKEEGFEDVWFATTLLEKTASGKYLIEHAKLRNEDDTSFLREEVDGVHLRPNPPYVGSVDSFGVNGEVDALYNDGWRVGVILRVLKNDKFIVYFRKTKEKSTFEHSDLRVHQEWRNGKWHISSKVLK